ncbi:MAG: DUF3298 and DUF4163 domain-containing protein [Qipengyuania sp.]|nr:DUF3298 and DUF4163 domain-containing protein [Qipengyuania sp.]
MRGPLFLIPLLLSSGACSSASEIEEATGVEETRAKARAAPAPAATPVAFANDEQRDGGSREFAYRWPAAVSAHPALARLLTEERGRILAREKVEWTDALADSPIDCAPCRGRSFAKQWKVVADTPGYLSLSGEFSSYTGGAHGMYGLESLVWDKARQAAMPGVGLFRSPEALEAALGSKLCAALDAEREKRRGEPVVPSDDDTGFDSCQQVKDATVLIGSSNGGRFDRLGIWFDPYVAGPYAEGAYELDFPVDAAVLKAVKPEYAGAFAAGR